MMSEARPPTSTPLPLPAPLLAAPTAAPRLDAINLLILRILEQDGRASISSIARQVGLTDNAVRYRLRRLRSSGVVRRVTVHVDPARLGRGRAAMVLLQLQPGADISALRAHPRLAMVLPTRGRYQVAALVVARDSEDLDRFLREELRRTPGLVDSLVLDIQPGADLPIQPSACAATAGA